MRESRVNVWNTTSHAADGATTGPTIDLLDGYVGDYLYGTSLYGFPVEIIMDSVSMGTDVDGITATWKWQFAPDDGTGSPGTWVDGPTIGVVAVASNGEFTKDGTLAGDKLVGLTRGKLQSRARTTKRFARLVCTIADLEGGATLRSRAFMTDGTLPYADTGVVS